MSTFSNDIGREEEDGGGWGGLLPEKRPMKVMSAAHSTISEFEEWWSRDGRFYDPDTEDVHWYDKRKFLAEYAFNAARAK